MYRQSKGRADILFSLPLAVIQGLFWVSLITIFLLSFCRRGEHGEIVYELSFDNYARIFSDPIYLRIFLRSFLLAAGNATICFLFGFPVAYFIATRNTRVRLVLVSLMIIPFATNFLIRTYAWIFILRTGGLLESLLSSLSARSPNLLFTEQAVMIGLLYNYLPFMVLPLYGSLHRFDFALIDAAKDLGANRLQCFLNITLPLCRSGISAGLMLVFIPSLGEFVIPDLLGGAKNMMLGNLIKMQFFEARNWPFGAALTVMLTVVIFLIMGCFRLLSRRIEILN
jgi:spermidine/putrescine transport system permease protein